MENREDGEGRGRRKSWSEKVRLWLGDGAEQVGKLKLFLRLKRKGREEETSRHPGMGYLVAEKETTLSLSPLSPCDRPRERLL